jgi:hypothetical protein
MRALNLIEKEQIAFAINTDNEELWHKRLGYFHHVGPIYMQRHNLVRGVPRLEKRSTNSVAC